MIDIAAAYERFGNILADRGQEAKPYCISMFVWNHRHGAPAVTFDASIHMAPGEVLLAGSRPTLEQALDDIAALLDKRLRRAPAGPTLADLGEVRLHDHA